MPKIKLLIGGKIREVDFNQSIARFPEIETLIIASYNKLLRHHLFFLENIDSFKKLLVLNEKEISEKIKELKELESKQDIRERDNWFIIPKHLKEQEGKMDKGAKFYKKKKR